MRIILFSLIICICKEVLALLGKTVIICYGYFRKIRNIRWSESEDEKFRIITACHITSGAHLGVDKTVNKISDRYYWKGIYKDVRNYDRNCDSCQISNKKHKTTKPEMEPITVPPSTWKKIAVDLIGPYSDDNGKPLSDAGYRYF